MGKAVYKGKAAVTKLKEEPCNLCKQLLVAEICGKGKGKGKPAEHSVEPAFPHEGRWSILWKGQVVIYNTVQWLEATETVNVVKGVLEGQKYNHLIAEVCTTLEKAATLLQVRVQAATPEQAKEQAGGRKLNEKRKS